VTLSTDDPGVSRNDLSAEYALLASRYGLTYPEIKRISENAVTCSFLDPATKALLKARLQARFQVFEKGRLPVR
jgi:adenosine deaminase